MRLSSGCSGRRSEPSTCAASTSATGSACTARSREHGPRIGGRAGERRRDPRALRARVARAAGGDRHPRRRDEADGRRTAVRAARRPRRGAARRGEPQLRRPVRTAAGRVRSGRSTRSLEAFRTGDGVPYADYGADLHEGQARIHAADVHTPARAGVAAVRARDPRAAPGRSARAGRRRRLRRWAARASRSRAATRRCTSTGSTSTRRRSNGARGTSPGAASRTGSRFDGRDAADPSPRAAVRPRDGLRGAARHVVPGRRAARGARAARRGRRRARRRRADGRVVRRPWRRPRAPLLRVQHPPLPAGRDGRRRRGRHGHSHAPGNGRGLRARRRLRAISRSPRSRTTSGASTSCGRSEARAGSARVGRSCDVAAPGSRGHAGGRRFRAKGR